MTSYTFKMDRKIKNLPFNKELTMSVIFIEGGQPKERNFYVYKNDMDMICYCSNHHPVKPALFLLNHMFRWPEESDTETVKFTHD